ncbi:hypothetical protein CT0861_06867 [Colletotrichum tofieldiae]|uniref:Uncharacterized protein n=1 Tax=Colletotrichum tofieldiae TaxID=708197 RepID=A0A166Y1Z3_9PEZI|nr:hypothetical protein CT0861_06867 [Colletotrichum tofieldiae]
MHETHKLVCLTYIRAVSPTDLTYRENSSQLADALEKPHFEVNEHSSQSLLLAVNHCLDFLEEPANTGFAYYIHHYASAWGFEIAIWTFESAVFMSKWLDHCMIGKSSTHDLLIERAKNLLVMAFSSLQDAFELSNGVDVDNLPRLTLQFWGQVLSELKTKPFAMRLGKALDILAQFRDEQGQTPR